MDAYRTPLYLAVLLAVLMPAPLRAADLEVGGWIPYWAVSKGTSEARKHIEALDVIHPFGYTLRQNGTLHDAMGLKKSAWKKLFKDAKDERVLTIPSITTSNGALVHRLLSDPEERAAHIKNIVRAVEKGKFDGIDIDYEGKKSETKEYFSLFLKELKDELGKKLLTCAIEPRTPPNSLYKEIPQVINYSNDYNAIFQ
jgi:spore germination protein